MKAIFFKDDKVVKEFAEGTTPFLDILDFSYSGESLIVNVGFADETYSGRPQLFSARFGTDFDRFLVES